MFCCLLRLLPVPTLLSSPVPSRAAPAAALERTAPTSRCASPSPAQGFRPAACLVAKSGAAPLAQKAERQLLFPEEKWYKSALSPEQAASCWRRCPPQNGVDVAPTRVCFRQRRELDGRPGVKAAALFVQGGFSQDGFAGGLFLVPRRLTSRTSLGDGSFQQRWFPAYPGNRKVLLSDNLFKVEHPAALERQGTPGCFFSGGP